MEQDINYKRIPWLRDPVHLTRYMTIEEIKCFFDSIDSLKHRAIFMTIYGSGLRLCEAGRLKIGDVDSKRMRLLAFVKYREKSGISPRATVHTLRHSYATHLLEAGTSLLYIQQLLGHSALWITKRYLHVAQTDVLQTPSPLDTMNSKSEKKRGRPRKQVAANA